MPHVICAFVSRSCSILCKPNLICAQLAGIQLFRKPVLIRIDSCSVPCALNRLAECLTYLCSSFYTDLVCASAAGLNIQEYGIIDLVILNLINYVRRFIDSLNLIYCLREEVYAYLQSSISSALNICGKLRILDQLTFRRTTVTTTNDHKRYAGVLYGFPVDGTIPSGYVNAKYCASAYQCSIGSKSILSSLYYLLARYVFSFCIKEINFSIQRLPSSIFYTTLNKELCAFHVIIRVYGLTIVSIHLNKQLLTILIYQCR